MSALPNFSCVDKIPGAVGPCTKGERVDAGRASGTAPVRSGKAFATVDARISSLKILAQSIVREIQSLEVEDGESTPDVLDLQAEVHRFEAELIRSALVRTEGRQRRAARLLGMKVTTLNAKIRRYKIA
jgi:DNA-binding NtrC family response regulator